jgi:hypothetical protein
MRGVSVIACLAFGAPALAAPEGRFCVENLSPHAAFFTTETREGVRQTATLEPGGLLCSGETAAADGVVQIFEDATSLEGCGRIVPRDATEGLVAYAPFDRCHWTSHDR